MANTTRSDKDKKAKFTRENVKNSIRIFSYIRPYRFYFLAGLILVILSSASFMIFPQASGEMANTALGQGRFDLQVKDYIWVFAGILLFQGLFSYLRTICMAIVSENAMADLRKDVFNKIMSFRMSNFESYKTGELTSRITADIEKLQSTFSITLIEFVRQFIVLAIGLVILFYVAPKLSLIMLVAVPICVIIAYYFGTYIRKLSRNRQDYIAQTNSTAEEALQSFQTVKAFTNELLESIRYGGGVDKIVNISLKFARVRGLFFMFIVSILFGGLFYILWRGALLVQSGEMGGGDLFSFIVYAGIIGASIAGIGSLFTDLLSAMGATDRVLEILDQGSEIDRFETQEELDSYPKISGNIQFNDVHFTYPSRDNVEVIKGIDFTIEEGQKVAFVGSSGAGKSTIVQLLMRFYDVDKGSIWIDGKEINTFDIQHLREEISIVPQDVILFGTTIRENILYGKNNATDEEIYRAAEQANALEFIQNFPDGFDTMVGERGVKLSGGQKQRIAIARGIIKDPAFLILDEATSSLDAESEKQVQIALNQVMEDRTSIVIAHRLATIRSVDCIYVLDKGRIIEKGTHNELYNDPNSFYHSLARLQFEEVTTA